MGPDGARIIANANAVIKKYDAGGGLKGRASSGAGKKGLPAGATVDTSSVEERMREAVRAQGRLTKSGGMVVSSGASEFQQLSGAALENLVGRR